MGLGQFRFGRLGELGRVRNWVFGVGIAVLAVSAVAFASAPGRVPAGPSDPASPAGRIESAFATVHSEIGDNRAPHEPHVRLASLHQQAGTTSINHGERTAPAPAAERASFNERFNSLAGERFASFDERFAVTPTGGSDGAAGSVRSPDWLASAEYRLEQEIARIALRGTVADAPAPRRPTRLAYAPSDIAPGDLLADPGQRTAIYDITAKVVYLPSGAKLEAHSGYGEHMDDLRSVAIRNKGVTPPNVYKLSLRDKLFHGVQAIRMTPVGPGRMYGRDGFLVHSYLLGPDGQSNGCVSINDYAKFLTAFMNGDIDRLVVVERLENAPAEPSGDWLAERLRTLFEAG